MMYNKEYDAIRQWAHGLLSFRAQTGLINAMVCANTPIASVSALSLYIANEKLTFNGECHFKGKVVGGVGKKSWKEIMDLHDKHTETRQHQYSPEIREAIELLSANGFKVSYPSV